MKKLVFIFLSLTFFMGCDNDDTKKLPDNPGATEKIDPDVDKGLQLIAKSDCFSCHKLTEQSIGPSYAAISEKYKNLDQAAMDSMVRQIIDGGSGRWGTIPMTPHKDMPKDEAQLMVKYIMSIKK